MKTIFEELIILLFSDGDLYLLAITSKQNMFNKSSFNCCKSYYYCDRRIEHVTFIEVLILFSCCDGKVTYGLFKSVNTPYEIKTLKCF